MASDTESDTGSTCSDASIGVGSVSMREDLEKVNKMLSFLKNFSPEKRKAGRPSKSSNGVAANTLNLDKVITVMDAIYSLNVRMLSKLESLMSTNSQLKCDIDQIAERQASSPSYSDVVSRGVPVPQGSSIGRRSSALRNNTCVPTDDEENFKDPPVLRLEKRLDCVEQESLVKVMACNGSFVQSIVDSSLVNATVNKAEATRNPEHLKKLFVDKVNVLVDNTLRTVDVEGIDIIGKEKKHVRVSFVTREARNRTLMAVKRKKPDNLFVNEYLTKTRAALLYKLRVLKRCNESIVKVYAWHGKVCAKIKKKLASLMLTIFKSLG
jgi:hypothetical protein